MINASNHRHVNRRVVLAERKGGGAEIAIILAMLFLLSSLVVYAILDKTQPDALPCYGFDDGGHHD